MQKPIARLVIKDLITGDGAKSELALTMDKIKILEHYLRNNNDGLRQAANRYIAQIRNANGQLTIPPSNLMQRGGSLILPTGSGNLDLGNSDFSMAVNDAANESLEFQAQVDAE